MPDTITKDQTNTTVPPAAEVTVGFTDPAPDGAEITAGFTDPAPARGRTDAARAGPDGAPKGRRNKREKKPPNKKRRKIIARCIWIVLLLGALGGLAYAVKVLFFTEKPVYYATMPIYRGMLSNAMEGYGQVRPLAAQDIGVTRRSTILEVFFAEGDEVFAGDVLFTVDPKDLDEEVAALEEELRTFQEQLTEAQQELAEKAGETSVYTPFAGKLLGVQETIRLGDEISAGQEIGVLVDDASMLLTQYYSYAYEHDITLGMTAQISVPASMTVLEGTVTDIAKVRRITPDGTVLFEVVLSVPNPGALSMDMAAMAVMTSAGGEEILPFEAGVLRYARQQSLYVGASGRLTVWEPRSYYDYPAGALLCQVDFSPDLTQVEALQQRVDEKQKEIDAKKEEYEELSITAPIDGTVMYNRLVPGETYEPGTAQISIAQLKNMIVEAQIDERDVGSVYSGMPVTLTQYTYEGERYFSGVVDTVSLEGKNEYGMTYFPATILVEDMDGSLMAGMGVNFSAITQERFDILIAPVDAVRYTSVGEVVLVKAEQAPANAVEVPELQNAMPPGFYAVPVVVGMGNAEGIEIIEGVEENAEVLTQELDYDPNEMDEYGNPIHGGGMVMREAVAVRIG